MRRTTSSIAVFSISALDLFAAALGAFILIVLVLFPYYRLGGEDTSFEELMEQVERRRFVASSTQTEVSQIRALQREIALLDKEYRTTETEISEIEAELQEVLKKIADSPEDTEDPDPIPVPDPEPKPEPPEPPRSVNTGQIFSILGLATDKQDVIILVDMSGSMNVHRDKVVQAVREVLGQLGSNNRFAIIGYRGGPTFDSFPASGKMTPADPGTLLAAERFVDRLPRRFGGGTPTQTALLRALLQRPEAIILMSDGAPDDGRPASIVANVSQRNRGRAEIHTVAIGDYTQDKALTLFLQALAANNRGDFVGRAR